MRGFNCSDSPVNTLGGVLGGVRVWHPAARGEPPYNTMDITDICTELAARAGLLREYNEAINAGIILGIGLQGKGMIMPLSREGDTQGMRYGTSYAGSLSGC